ncbi:MAG TPA: cytochrome P450 [Bryobacteraceae bacterium]|jgi:cytochrome P450|nr:cytochrome P450 [Bryobacteraceae bacterium]
MQEVLNTPLSAADPAALEQCVPSAGVLDTLAIFADVLLPTVAKGVIMRRRSVMNLAERLQLDRRAIRRMQMIRSKYGTGPILLRLPGRRLAVVLDPRHVHRILQESPEPFATATPEKRAALAHFEPKNALISTGAERADRRRYNEQVLESGCAVHSLVSDFARIADTEAARLCVHARESGELNWQLFSDAWFRLVRRVVFGEAAADDHELSSVMARLRQRANWAFLAPRRPELRQDLFARIEKYLNRAEQGSLAGVMAHIHATAVTEPVQQVPQWLFAFDPAGMATFRTLALLGSHPDYARLVRSEIGAISEQLPFTRAAVLESLRLWPTTPLILRETTEPTVWEMGTLPAQTGMVIFTPFFHRDNERLLYADRFAPELWSNPDQPRDSAALVPFSEGPAICPGRNLVLLLASLMITAVLENTRLRLKRPAALSAALPLPAMLNHFNLRFELAARS